MYVTLNGRPDDGEDGEGDNVGGDVEIILGGTVRDPLTGDGNANALSAGSGEDLITGDAGPDVVNGGDAPDQGVVTATPTPSTAAMTATWRSSMRATTFTLVVDRPGRPAAPQVGGSALVRPARSQSGCDFQSGTVLQAPGSRQDPGGSTIDAREGEVRVATARNRTGARQEIAVSRGVFSVRQKTGSGPSRRCRLWAAPRVWQVRRGPKSSRRLSQLVGSPTRVNKGKPGRFAVRGRYSIGAATGTAG